MNKNASVARVLRWIANTERDIAAKSATLAATKSKSHQTRLEREIESLQERLAEYRAFVNTH